MSPRVKKVPPRQRQGKGAAKKKAMSPLEKRQQRLAQVAGVRVSVDEKPIKPGDVVVTVGGHRRGRPAKTVTIGDVVEVNGKKKKVALVDVGVVGKRIGAIPGQVVSVGKKNAPGIPAHVVRPLPKGESIKFGTNEIVELYKTSPDFRKMAESGRFIYAGGKIILNRPGCVELSDDGITVIPAKGVLRDPVGYCLRSVRHKDTVTFQPPERYKDLTRAGINIGSFIDSVRDRLIFPSHGGTTGGGNDGGDDTDLFDGDDGFEAPLQWDDSANEDLQELVMKYIHKRKTSIEKLAKYLGISEATISRFWTEVDMRPNLDNVVAVCLALHLLSLFELRRTSSPLCPFEELLNFVGNN